MARRTTKLTPEELAEVKKQILEDMRNEQIRQQEETTIRQKQQKEKHEEYIGMMKISPDPWVEVIGWTQDRNGVKVELEWNDAFVAFLRENGITGADDNQVVQRWVTLLLRDMADEMDSQVESKYE